MNEELKVEYDTSDMDAVKGRKRRIIQKQKQNDLDLYNIMATPAGRNVIGRIISLKNPFSMSFSSDPYNTAFNEGMRRISCILTDELTRVCPESYLTLVRENLKQDSEANNE